MTPLFTELVGMDATRSQDVDLAARCLDLLWQSQPQVLWREITENLASLRELQGEEEPAGLLAYAYDGVATLYYADLIVTPGRDCAAPTGACP
ncbi:hypothetical protein [Streptomyces paradoxus]|uniref:hypothetical protein n=1 Tax=Streptomyces paradoxus TaxID=66375 RepID=UPI0037CF0D63